MTVYLNALGLVCALGRDKQEVACNLFAGDCGGMREQAGWVQQRTLPVGAVQGKLATLPADMSRHHSRNNQLLLEACLLYTSPSPRD